MANTLKRPEEDPAFAAGLATRNKVGAGVAAAATTLKGVNAAAGMANQALQAPGLKVAGALEGFTRGLFAAPEAAPVAKPAAPAATPKPAAPVASAQATLRPSTAVLGGPLPSAAPAVASPPASSAAPSLRPGDINTFTGSNGVTRAIAPAATAEPAASPASAAAQERTTLVRTLDARLDQLTGGEGLNSRGKRQLYAQLMNERSGLTRQAGDLENSSQNAQLNAPLLQGADGTASLLRGDGTAAQVLDAEGKPFRQRQGVTDSTRLEFIGQQIKALNTDIAQNPSLGESGTDQRLAQLAQLQQQAQALINPGKAGAGGGFQEGQVYNDANGNTAKYVNGNWVPVE